MNTIGTIYVFRHGEADKLSMLTPEGALQCARSAATHLMGVPVSAVYHGEMPRAEDSAIAMQPHCLVNPPRSYIAKRYWADFLKMLRHYGNPAFDRSVGECYQKAPKGASARWWLDNLETAHDIRTTVRAGMIQTLSENVVLNWPNLVMVYHDPLIALLVDNLDDLPGTLGNGDCIKIEMKLDETGQWHFIGTHLPCPPA